MHTLEEYACDESTRNSIREAYDNDLIEQLGILLLTPATLETHSGGYFLVWHARRGKRTTL